MRIIKFTSAILTICVVCSAITFASVGRKEATLSYDNIMITIDGTEIVPTDAVGNAIDPFIIDGTTYLPVRGIATSLGLDVGWEASTKTVKLTKSDAEPTPSAAVPSYFTGKKTAELYYNDIKITLDGNRIIPKDEAGNEIEPFIIDGTTYLPVRGVATALGLDVEWNGALKMIKLTRLSEEALNMIREDEISMLKNTHYRLTVDKELNVAYLGGSITIGHGASTYGQTYLGVGRNDKCFAGLTTDYIRELFPDAKVNELNAGIGNTGSNYGIFRLREHILDKMTPDLIFIEYTNNDWGRFGEENISRQNESIIRMLYEANPKIDIVFVYTAQNSDSVARKASIALADHYNLLQFDVGVAMKRVIDTQYGGDYKSFSADNLHPTDKGYAYYMSHISTKLYELLVDNAPKKAQYRDILLAESLNKSGIFTNPKTLDVDEFPLSDGFTRINRTLGGHYLMQNIDHYYEGNTEGAKFTFEFEGTGFGLLVGKSEDLANFKYKIDGGAEKSYVLADTQLSDHLQTYIVEYNLTPEKHTVEIIIDPSHVGSRLRIAKIFVNSTENQ